MVISEFLPVDILFFKSSNRDLFRKVETCLFHHLAPLLHTLELLILLGGLRVRVGVSVPQSIFQRLLVLVGFLSF